MKYSLLHTVYHNVPRLSTPGVHSRKKNVDRPEIVCYKKENIETDEAEIKADMRLQRVRGAESRVEMQTDKWTIEGVVKSSCKA